LPEQARVRTPVLDIAYEHSGPAQGLPVVLLHGYPYDVRAFDEVVPILNRAGLRTIVPYLRGYGGTRFLSPDTPRSGEQAAVGQDLLELLDALDIAQAGLAGFDWGSRAACVVAALWPQRVRGLVSSAASFENPDFVDVVIHSYRHRMGNAPGDPRYAAIEAQLARLPKIAVPTIAVHGAVDDVNPVRNTQSHQKYFTGRYERRVFENIGHNPPQEAPRAFADAILDICK